MRYSNEAEFGQQAIENLFTAAVNRSEHQTMMDAFTVGYYLLCTRFWALAAAVARVVQTGFVTRVKSLLEAGIATSTGLQLWIGS